MPLWKIKSNILFEQLFRKLTVKVGVPLMQ